MERDDLKGLARLTKKKELDSKIARKNEEIRILKGGLSGIVKQYSFSTVEDFYTAFYASKDAFYRYQKECNKCEETYGKKDTPKEESFEERLQKYRQAVERQYSERTYRSKDKGAR